MNMHGNGDNRLRLAIIGTGKRVLGVYDPVLRAMKDCLELVAVWGRRQESAERLGKQLGVPWYTNLERLTREAAPDLGIVCVNYQANGQVGLMAVEQGLHVLLETPIAHRLSEADAIIKSAEERGVVVEVAEQFHKRPMEQAKLKLLATGLFGNVHTAFNDFAGHGYHGVSVMRSYLGFEAQPALVQGSVHQFELAAHWSRLANSRGPRQETQEHGMITFADGRLGVFHWTNVGYDSAIRWWRSSRFLAEKGMGISVGVGIDTQEWLSLMDPEREAPRFITLERRWERNDGGALAAIVAYTGDPELPIVRWDNPLLSSRPGSTMQLHDDEIGVAGCLLSLVDAVQQGQPVGYGAAQARLDQEVTLAIRLSAQQGGRPVSLPLDPELDL